MACPIRAAVLLWRADRRTQGAWQNDPDHFRDTL